MVKQRGPEAGSILSETDGAKLDALGEAERPLDGVVVGPTIGIALGMVKFGVSVGT